MTQYKLDTCEYCNGCGWSNPAQAIDKCEFCGGSGVTAVNNRRDPWLYECKATRNTLHTWVKSADGTSECKHCHTRQTVEQTARCFWDYAQ